MRVIVISNSNSFDSNELKPLPTQTQSAGHGGQTSLPRAAPQGILAVGAREVNAIWPARLQSKCILRLLRGQGRNEMASAGKG